MTRQSIWASPLRASRTVGGARDHPLLLWRPKTYEHQPVGRHARCGPSCCTLPDSSNTNFSSVTLEASQVFQAQARGPPETRATCCSTLPRWNLDLSTAPTAAAAVPAAPRAAAPPGPRAVQRLSCAYDYRILFLSHLPQCEVRECCPPIRISKACSAGMPMRRDWGVMIS